MGPVASGLKSALTEVRLMVQGSEQELPISVMFKSLTALLPLANQMVWTHLANEKGGDTSLSGPASMFIRQVGQAFQAGTQRSKVAMLDSLDDAIQSLES